MDPKLKAARMASLQSTTKYDAKFTMPIPSQNDIQGMKNCISEFQKMVETLTVRIAAAEADIVRTRSMNKPVVAQVVAPRAPPTFKITITNRDQNGQISHVVATPA